MPLSATPADRDQAAALTAIHAGAPRDHDLSASWTSLFANWSAVNENARLCEHCAMFVLQSEDAFPRCCRTDHMAVCTLQIPGMLTKETTVIRSDANQKQTKEI